MSESVVASDSSEVGTFRLEVHPSVVFKLGADLITDDMQALIELIKNSYDADATSVRVIIDTQVDFDPGTGEPSEGKGQRPIAEGSQNKKRRGSITIIDDGTGMDLAAIRRGWLTVSLSDKQKMKARGETTRRKRTPLGDKGLGRLGAQRLGDVLSLTTRMRSQSTGADTLPLQVTLTWSDFAAVDSLNAVPISISTVRRESVEPGTILKIEGLRDPEFWRAHETNDLQRELATMISPYEGVSGFHISMSIDGHPINLREAAQALLQAAPVSYSFKFDGEALEIIGRFTTDFLRPPQDKADIAVFEELIGPDNGFSFAEWLLTEKSRPGRVLGVEMGDDRHFLVSRSRIPLNELTKVEISGGRPVGPGPFHGEVSGLPLSRDTTNVFNRTADYRQFVKAIVGIKVYRDGFGIRVDDDWLKLGEKWTSGASYYSLRPGNVTGYVSISAKHNAVLEETSNRESFRDTAAYRNFYALLTAWADYTARVQEYLRRSYNDYRKAQLERAAGVEPVITPEALIRGATHQIERTQRLAKETADASASIREIRSATEDLEREKTASESTVFQDPAFSRMLDATITKVRNAAAEADIQIGKLNELLAEQSALKDGIQLLEHQIDVVQQQISDAWESVSLGLSAEAMSHEVQHVSDGLRARSAQITRYLNNVGSSDQRVWTFVEHVRSAASALSNQVSRLSPSLRYMRDRREVVVMSEMAESLRQYYAERWARALLRIEVRPLTDFSVRVNPGKLNQVFDNLVLNSEYWLRQQIAARTLQEGVITIVIDGPYVLFEDNGLGFDPSIEEIAFDPFVTMKPSQQGRGLGLFVVRQLLDSMDSSIALTPERNNAGRRYQLRLNFVQALSNTGV